MAELMVHRFDYPMPDNLADFDVANYVDGALKWIDGLVGKHENVALSASGGVDSTTVAFLLKDVLGERLHPFFINDGLRRIINGKEEWEVTAEMFKSFPNFEVIHTRELVIPWFEGIDDGTLKREMFRNLYTMTSNKYISSFKADWISDGTIHPDIVMTDQNRQIQHNVNLPYNMKKLEPFSALYKPHVRRVAAYLGMPRDFTMRIPCPGPAQLLRVGGVFTSEKLRVSKIATDIVEQMVGEYCKKLWGTPYKYDETTGVRTPFQYFATCLDSEMSLEHDLSKIIRSLSGIACSSFKMMTPGMWIDMRVRSQQRKLYAPIVWVTGPPVTAQELGHLYETLNSQACLPRVLYEVFDSGKKGYPVGIKVVESEDVRTTRPMKFDFSYLVEMGQAICSQAGASKVAFDISPRPPATIELF